MSLQDQLLKAGLTTKDKVTKANSEKRKKAKINRKHKVEVTDQDKQAAEQLLAEKAQKDRELNQQKNAQLEQKALMAQVKQLIESNQQDLGKPIVTFQFSDNGAIKQIEVSNLIHKHIGNGLLGITRINTQYYLVPKAIIEKIRQRAPEFIILINEQQQDTEEDDDPYADYQIPDDLMW
ncbi:DUF2058 domain-containing protein [Aliikangiella maris]|uniref:DUF2058 domain-containing protein n=2 Tax=Aliikangiella maris TaxID=3162458 RepID=A0ABV2BZ71_9GAMM